MSVKFFPAEAAGGLKYIKSIAAPYGDVTFMPTGGVNEKNLLDYLSFNKIICCGGSWMVPGDAVKAKDWNRVTELTRQAVKVMPGLKLEHIGINSGSPEKALADAKALCALTGLALKEGNSSVFAGSEYECMKKAGRGANGHIALSTPNLMRAKWHLEQRGVEFDEDSLTVRDGRPAIVYMKNEIAGFAIHLLQK